MAEFDVRKYRESRERPTLVLSDGTVCTGHPLSVNGTLALQEKWRQMAAIEDDAARGAAAVALAREAFGAYRFDVPADTILNDLTGEEAVAALAHFFGLLPMVTEPTSPTPST